MFKHYPIHCCRRECIGRCVYLCMYLFVCMYMYVYARVPVCIRVCMHMSVCMCLYLCHCICWTINIFELKLNWIELNWISKMFRGFVRTCFHSLLVLPRISQFCPNMYKECPFCDNNIRVSSAVYWIAQNHVQLYIKMYTHSMQISSCDHDL